LTWYSVPEITSLAPPAAFLFGSLGLPARRRASSKENSLKNRIRSGEARTASQKSQNLAEQNWYSTRTSDTSLRRPRTLLYTLGARCSSNGQRMASKQQPIQSAAGGGWILTQQRYSVLCLPHEGTRKGKRPVLAALHCGRSFSTRRTPRPTTSVQQGAAFGATTGRPAGKIGGRRGSWERDCCRCWSRSWLELELGSFELELGVCAEDSAPSFELLSVVLGPKGAILAQPLPSPFPSLPSPPLPSPP
jgi:hypothetical protein